MLSFALILAALGQAPSLFPGPSAPAPPLFRFAADTPEVPAPVVRPHAPDAPPARTCDCPCGCGASGVCVCEPRARAKPAAEPTGAKARATAAPVSAPAPARQWVIDTTRPHLQGFGRIDAAGYLVDVVQWRGNPEYRAPAPAAVASPPPAPAGYFYGAMPYRAMPRWGSSFGFGSGSCAGGSCR